MPETNETRAWPYLLCGMAVGAAIGILFAPRKGEETREYLDDWMKMKRVQSREFFDKVREKYPEKREKVIAALKAGKEWYQHTGNHKRHTVHA